MLACVAGASLASWATPAEASSSQSTIFDAPREFRGYDGGRQQALNEIDAFGVDTVRMLVFWRDVAPAADQAVAPAEFPGVTRSDPVYYDYYAGQSTGGGFSSIDAVVRGAADRGMKVMLVPSGKWPSGKVPRWASNDPDGSESDPIPAEFEDFIHAIGSRYRGDYDPAVGGPGPENLPHVDIISPWNEGNGDKFLQPQGTDGDSAASIYRDLLNAAQTGLELSGWPEQPGSTLLVGETAPRDTIYAVNPLTFIRKVYCLNASWTPVGGCTPPQIDEDGFSHHPYSFGSAPYIKPSDPNHINVGNLGLLSTALDKIHAAYPSQFGNLPIYITEYGADGDPARPERIATQAEYIAIAERIAYENPRIASFSQYQMRDDPIEGNAGIATGLRPFDSAYAPCGEPDTDCKPAYAAFRTPLAVRTVGKAPCLTKPKKPKGKSKKGKKPKLKCKKYGVPPTVSIWGRVRPARSAAETSRQATIQYRDGAKSWQALKTVTVNSGGYFSFNAKNAKGRVWRLRWTQASSSVTFTGPEIEAFTY